MERSKGKMRPSLVRASDLQPTPEAEAKPTGDRAAHGHFAANNRIGVEARVKHSIRKCLGAKEAPGAAGIVAADARRVCGGTLRALPSDAIPVRSLVALHARHMALNAYYTAKAEAVGLDTPEGLKFLEVADRQSQRAERTLVTAEDVARVHAQNEQGRPLDVHAVNAQAEHETELRRQAERAARAAAADVQAGDEEAP